MTDPVILPFSSLTATAALAVVLSGLLFGAFVLWLSPTVSTGATSPAYVCFVFALAGIIFFIARGLMLYYEASPLWPRNIGFAGLWILYCASMGVGIALRRRLT